MSNEIVVDGERYRRTQSGGWWEGEFNLDEWYPVQNPELLDEIERLRAVIAEHQRLTMLRDESGDYEIIGEADETLWAECRPVGDDQ